VSVDVATLSLKVDSTDVKGATSAMDRMTSVGSGLEGVVKKVVAAWASWKVVEYAREAATLAARYETLGVVMGAVGRNAGYSQGQMALYAQALQQTGISAIESRNVLTMMAGAQMDLAKSSEMARIAQDAAVIGNINSSEAFQRMVQGIRSGETEILRTIGISVNFEQAYQKMGKTLGKTSKDLTDLEKLMARQNIVMEYGSKIAGAYEASMGTAGKQALSMTRYLEDLQVKVGEAFLPAFSESVMTLTGALKEANEWIDSNHAGITDLAQSMNSAVVSGEAFLGTLSQIAGGSGTASDSLEVLSTVFRGIGLTIATTADLIQTAVGDVAVIVGSLANIPGMDNPIYSWGKNQINGANALDKFLDSVEQGQGKVSAAAIKTEQLASAQEAVNKYTAEYNRLKGAMERAGDDSKENRDLLEQLGLWKDIFTFKVASLKAGTPEEMGPVAPAPMLGAASRNGPSGTGAGVSLFQREIELLKWQSEQYTKSAESASKHADAITKDNLALQDFVNSLQPAVVEAEKMAQVQYDLGWALADGIINQEKYNELLGTAKVKFTAAGQAAEGYKRSLQQDAARLSDPTSEAGQRLNDMFRGGLISAEIYQREMQKVRLEQLRLKAEAGNTWAIIGDVVTQNAGHATDAMVNWMDNLDGVGRSWKTLGDTVRSVISDMLVQMQRAIIQQQLMQPLMNWAGSAIGGMFTGGTTSGAMNSGAGYSFTGVGDIGAGAMSYGGSFSAPQSAQSTIIINIASDGTSNTKNSGNAMAQEIQRNVEPMVLKVIDKHMRPGGRLNPTSGGGMR